MRLIAVQSKGIGSRSLLPKSALFYSLLIVENDDFVRRLRQSIFSHELFLAAAG
jgi:hypothetical protein